MTLWPAFALRSEVILEVTGLPVFAETTGQSHVYLDPRQSSVKGGSRSQGWSMLGREDLAAVFDDEYDAKPCPKTASRIAGEAAVLTDIVEQARKHRVVIINESHTVTLHRDFSRCVIRALRPHGFSVLAAETFANVSDGPDPVDQHAHLPFLHQDIGYYSKEPVFAAMLREAKALGYRFAAYEQTFSSKRDREEEQAANLAAILGKMGQGEKLIVHVGYGHADEVPRVYGKSRDRSMMAARLKRDHGYDPLTLGQTVCRGGTQEIGLLAMPSDEGAPFDFAIEHPLSAFAYGRASWRFDGAYQPVAIPKAFAASDTPLIIEAFAEGDPFKALPHDRVWIEPGEDVRLALKPGRYTVRAVRPAVLSAVRSPTKP
ncbi:MAG: hypothetical protein AAF127_06340 [Pseudomonadota bacterium]